MTGAARLRGAAAMILGAALAVTAACAAPAPVPVKPLPFQFVRERQIVFPVTVNGHPAEAWLDSGASATVVDASFAKAAGLPPGTPVQAKGVSGAIGGVTLTTVDIATGGGRPEARRAAVMDMAVVARVVDRPVQVILGRDVFDSAVVDIDFARHELRLIPRDQFTPPKATPLPLRAAGGLRSVPIRIGSTEAQAILDLGHAGALMVTREFAEAHGLLAGRRTSTEIGVGADGAREDAVASLDQVSLAGIDFRGVPAGFPAKLSAQAPANVGLQILSRFHVILDFRGDRAWLIPDRATATAAFARNRLGLQVTRAGDRLSVVHVAPGSPAAAAGWKAGETIAAIDGHAVGPDYVASGAWAFAQRPAGAQVAFTMADGSARRLTAADYY